MPIRLDEEKAKIPTLTAFAERWFQEYVAINNKPSEQRAKGNGFRKHLLPCLGTRRLDDIRVTDIEDLKRNLLGSGLCAKSVNNIVAMLRRCLAIAVEWQIITAVPKIKLLRAPPPQYRFLQTHQVEALLQAADPGRWRTMILMAVRTGMRFSELVGLEWSDIDFERRQILVQRANVRGAIGTPKNNRFRRICIASDLYLALREMHPSEGPVFTQNGHAVGEAPAWRALRRTCLRARVDPIGWHVLRHTFASELVRRGASLQAIKELLGHSTIQMTLRYAHVSETMLRDTISLLDGKPFEKSGQPVGSEFSGGSFRTAIVMPVKCEISSIISKEPVLAGTGL